MSMAKYLRSGMVLAKALDCDVAVLCALGVCESRRATTEDDLPAVTSGSWRLPGKQTIARRGVRFDLAATEMWRRGGISCTQTCAMQSRLRRTICKT